MGANASDKKKTNPKSKNAVSARQQKKESLQRNIGAAASAIAKYKTAK